MKNKGISVQLLGFAFLLLAVSLDLLKLINYINSAFLDFFMLYGPFIGIVLVIVGLFVPNEGPPPE